MPGHAGNFLVRLFSLGKETMPQLPIAILANEFKLTPINENYTRLTYYSFSEAKSYPSWQEYNCTWADYHQDLEYQMMCAIWKKQALVYAMHPCEFVKFETMLADNPSNYYFYVELDIKYQSWVDQQKEELKFVYRPNESEQFTQLKDKYKMKSINLTAMLDSVTEFQEEYLRCCNLMQLTPCIDQALELYNNWTQVRK